MFHANRKKCSLMRPDHPAILMFLAHLNRFATPRQPRGRSWLRQPTRSPLLMRFHFDGLML